MRTAMILLTIALAAVLVLMFASWGHPLYAAEQYCTTTSEGQSFLIFDIKGIALLDKAIAEYGLEGGTIALAMLVKHKRAILLPPKTRVKRIGEFNNNISIITTGDGKMGYTSPLFLECPGNLEERR